MKRWALVTMLLYVLLAVSITIPLMQLCFNWGKNPLGLSKTLAMMQHWIFWLWIGVSVVSQAALLLVPIAISERRPISRRKLLVPVITAAFLLAFICVSAVMALAAGIWGDRSDKYFLIFGADAKSLFLSVAAYLGMAWIAWGLVFHSFLKHSADAATFISRLLRWLLRGSILELLVAVPSHVVSRSRHDCCAPILSFWGIATGLTVMLIAYGPGVFFLFAERMRRHRVDTNKNCAIPDKAAKR